MSRKVVTVTESTPFGDLVDLMLRHEIGAIPVVDDEGRPCGLVSEVDLISKQAYGGRQRPLSDGSAGVARRLVCRLAWLVPGVIDVVNRVTVGTSRPPIESPDAAGIG
jgi:CBS domain-containing protein